MRKRKTKSSGKITHKNKTVDGIKFDSIMESEFYTYVKELKSQGKIIDFELQPKFLLQDKFIIVDGKVIEGNDKQFNKLKKESKAETVRAINYIADFKLICKNEVFIIDVKGIKTADFKLKEKMFIHKYPEYKFYCVQKYTGEWMDFNEAEKLRKNKKKNK